MCKYEGMYSVKVPIGSKIHPSTQPSIHPSISHHLSGQQPKQACLDFPFPNYFVQLFPGAPEAFLGLPWGLLLQGLALNTMPGRQPGGLLTRFLSHLIWLFSSTTSSS